MNVWGNSAWAFDSFNYLVPYRDMIRKVVDCLPHSGLILDLGCGTGNLENALMKTGCRIIGLDSSVEMLKLARQKCPAEISFRQHDLNEPLPYEDGFADEVISINTLYMLEDMEKSLGEMRRVLKSNGTLILVHPKPMSFVPFIKAHFASGNIPRILLSLTQLPRMVKLFGAGRDVEESLKDNFLETNHLVELVQKAGFHPYSTEPIYGGISTLLLARRP